MKNAHTKLTLRPTYFHDAGFWILEEDGTSEKMMTVDGSFTREDLESMLNAVDMRLVGEASPHRVTVTLNNRFANKIIPPSKWTVASAETGEVIAEFPAALDSKYFQRSVVVDWAEQEGYTVIRSWHGGRN